MNSVVSFHLDNEYSADNIARLFPKCKPRSATVGSSSNSNSSAVETGTGSSSSSNQPNSPASTASGGNGDENSNLNNLTAVLNTNNSMMISSMDVNRIASLPSSSGCPDDYMVMTDGNNELCTTKSNHLIRSNGISLIGGGGDDSCSQASSSYGMSNEDDDSEELTTPYQLVHSSKSPLQSMMRVADNSRHLTPPPIIQHRRKPQKSTPQYKLRDSRIIEIAGGREVYSQSRSKVNRKSRSFDIDNKISSNTKTPGRVWELRARMNDDNGLENTPEITETVFGSEIKSVKHQHIQSTRGIVGNVVFDDIEDDDWRRGDTVPPLPSSQRTYRKKSEIGTNRNDKVTAGSSNIPQRNNNNNKRSNSENDDYKLYPPRTIGNLQIAEYEASPRRYGNYFRNNGEMPTVLSSPTMTAVAKPGFPQRILEQNENDTNNAGTDSPPLPLSSNPAFNYLYEYSETRKVLDEFFKNGEAQEKTEQQFQELEYELKKRKRPTYENGNSYVGLRLAEASSERSNRCSPYKLSQYSSDASNQDYMVHGSTSCTRSSDNLLLAMDFQFPPANLNHTAHHRYSLSPETERRFTQNRHNFSMSPDTTDCESNYGEGDSEISALMFGIDTDGNASTSGQPERLYPSMPVLEDGLSSGHNSDSDTNNATILLMKKQITEIEKEIERNSRPPGAGANATNNGIVTPPTVPYLQVIPPQQDITTITYQDNQVTDMDLTSLDPLERNDCGSPPSPAPINQRDSKGSSSVVPGGVEATIKDIRMTLQRTKVLPIRSSNISNVGDDDRESICSNKSDTPIWIPRKRGSVSGQSADEDELDTDLETDRLLGQQRTDDQGFFDEKIDWKKKSRSLLPFGFGGQNSTSNNNNNYSNITNNSSSTVTITSTFKKQMPIEFLNSNGSVSVGALQVSSLPLSPTDSEIFDNESSIRKDEEEKKETRSKEGMFHDPAVLIEGVLFRARYLGSTQLVCEGQPTKATRMMQAEEAVSRIKVENHHAGCKKAATFESESEDLDDILGTGLGPGTIFRLRFLGSVQVDEEEPVKRKPNVLRKRLKKNMVEEAVLKIKAPDGETQPSTDVDLFISTEKIMVLNTEMKEIVMDHALRTISYIADIGDLVVLMARRRFIPHEVEDPSKLNRAPKMICHVFESEEAQFIAQSIGQAFQVAYMEFLKANGIEDHSFVREMDYQEVLNSQEIFGDEIQMFAKKELQKDVVVPKLKGEVLGVVIVESGWGSMLPTVVIANLAPGGAAARSGQVNIGDQIIAINGVSLVGLPLSTCQNYIKNAKMHNVIKLTVVPCAPVVEVKIKRPDTKYQLGFSVQNGVICSLLRGGIAERGGVRVGHRIIEINNQSVVAVPHEKIVALLATSVGEILMKTMPTSMFRLLTGQETPMFI